MNDVKERLYKVISKGLGVPPERITPEKRFSDDLGADSLDRVELMMFVEEEFGIEIDDKTSEPWHTVGDVETYLNNLLGE